MNKTLAILLFAILAVSATFGQASKPQPCPLDEGVSSDVDFMVAYADERPDRPHHVGTLLIGSCLSGSARRESELQIDGKIVFFREQMKPHLMPGWTLARVDNCYALIVASAMAQREHRPAPDQLSLCWDGR